jgi:heme exporter protein D
MDWSMLLHMDGHGRYVWSAYLIAAVVLAVNFILPVRRRRALENDLRRSSHAPGVPHDPA